MIKLISYAARRDVTALVKFSKFAAGERHVALDMGTMTALAMFGHSNRFGITVDFRGSDDIIDLALLIDALKRNGSDQIDVTIPYFPAARQDRAVNPGEALSAKVIADLLQEICPIEKIEIWDPHSEVVPALFPAGSIKVIEQHILAARYIKLWNKSPVLVSPDAGAAKKIHKLAEYAKLPVLYATKGRNPVTGDIEETQLALNHADLDLKDKIRDLVIVDDICDGGRTFVALGKALKAYQPKARLHLYVTHGIFSYGMAPFENLFDFIYCPNVMNDAQRKFWSEDGVWDVKKMTPPYETNNPADVTNAGTRYLDNSGIANATPTTEDSPVGGVV